MDAPVSEACLLTTAGLLAQGKELAANSPFRILNNENSDCVSAILAHGTEPEAKSPFRILTNQRPAH
jgi:hypothetical protein